MEGQINIASAAELKKLLLEALASGRELRVDLDLATDLDVTALQLLWAAERAARGASKGFTLSGRVPDEIAIAMAEAGFEKFLAPADSK